MLRVTISKSEDQLKVRAINATVRNDGSDAHGSKMYDVLLDCSVAEAIDRLDVCINHNYATANIVRHTDDGMFHSKTRGLLAFEFLPVLGSVIIITASCPTSDLTDEKQTEYMRQALDKARDYARKLQSAN